jgi:EmrB/QacA subfamily drug resistance transporter
VSTSILRKLDPRTFSEQKSVALVFVVAMFMDIMDGTIVNTALPAIGKDFHHGSPTDLAWVVLGYLMSLAIFIPASGWLGDRYGTKKVFLFALAMFISASALCGFATSINVLTAFRFLQGIGGGMMTPVGTTMLYRAFPPHQRQRAGSLLAIPTLLAPATGPVLGGWITDTWSWRWIFYVNIPFGIAAFAFGWWRLKEYQHHAENRFDPRGFVLSATALGAILYGLNQVEIYGWSSNRVVIALLVGVIAGVALVATNKRTAEPLLALRLFRDPVFTVTNIVSIFATASFFGLILLMPLMLQGVRHLSPGMSGLTTFPQAFGVMLMSPFSRKLYRSVGPRKMMAIGLTVAGIIMLLLLRTDVTTNLWVYRAILFGRGLCWAFVFSPLQASAFSQVSLPDTGRASSLFSTQRQVASSLGIAVLISLLMTQFHKVGVAVATSHLTNVIAIRAREYNAYKVPFLWTCIFAFCGAVAALFLNDDKVLAVFRQREAQAAAPSKG